MKLLVKARKDLIVQKNELRKDLDRAFQGLRRLCLGYDVPKCNTTDHHCNIRRIDKLVDILEVLDCAVTNRGLYYFAKIITFDPLTYHHFWCPAEWIEERADELILNFHKWWASKPGPRKITTDGVVFIPVGKDCRKFNIA